MLTANALNNKDFAEIFAMSSADVNINGETLTVYNHNRLLNELDCCIGGKQAILIKRADALFQPPGKTAILSFA